MQPVAGLPNSFPQQQQRLGVPAQVASSQPPAASQGPILQQAGTSYPMASMAPAVQVLLSSPGVHIAIPLVIATSICKLQYCCCECLQSFSSYLSLITLDSSIKIPNLIYSGYEVTATKNQAETSANYSREQFLSGTAILMVVSFLLVCNC